MAEFTTFFPASGQTDVPRTTLVSFVVLEGVNGVQIGTLAATLNGVSVISGGAFANGYTGSILSGSGRYVIAIHPKAPSFLPSASAIAVTMDVLDSYGATDSYGYSFYTVGYGDEEEELETSPTRACLVGKPKFISNNAGLRAAFDEGVGTAVELSWNEAAPYDDGNSVVYNVYHATQRLDVFENPPRLLVTALTASVGGLPPGNMHFFGLRASEMDSSISTVSGMRLVGSNTYAYPESALDGYLSSGATTVPLDSVEGFPEMGIALVDDELIRYTSLRQYPPALILSSTSGRGYEGTVAESHSDGSSVTVYWGHEDGNTIIVQAVPSFQKPEYALTWVLSDGYGPDGYRDGYDGYDALMVDGYYFPRQVKRDDITTSGANNDASGNFPRFDYCGSYRGLSPSQLWQGQCIPSYFGGIQLRDGTFVRENNVTNHMLQREELLLESTGEPVILLRKLWTGVRCSCHMLRPEHPDKRCPVCYGIGFVNGYSQFVNPRRSDGRILVRVDPAVDDLRIENGGLTPDYKPDNWTMAFPAVKDRDILVRFNEDGTEEFRYAILGVTRVRAFFGQSGVQKFNMQRLVRTDIVYQYPVARSMRPYQETLETGVSSAPGIPAHSHTIILPHGASFSSFSGGTSTNQHHHHVIRNGVVVSVLGHTHSVTT